MVYPIALSFPGGAEWIVIAGIGLLVFGKRLPEVGRSLGKGIVEFKKGLKGVEEEVSQVDADIDNKTPPPQPPRIAQQTTVQQFAPYPGKPVAPSLPADPHATHG